MADVLGRPDPTRSLALGPTARRALVVGTALAVGAGAWLWTGLHPQVSSQGLLEVGGLPRDARPWARGPTGGRMVLELRNDGDLPFTARGGDSPVPVAGLVPVGPDGEAEVGTVARSLRVAPGSRALLLLEAGLLPTYCQGPQEQGQSRQVVVRLRTLGLPTTQRLVLPRPVQVAAPEPACR